MIQRFSQLQTTLSLFPEENFQIFKQRFFQSNLGKIYQSIPWQELIRLFGLKENKIGRKRIFPPQGMLALMFLKNYSGLSDEKIIEQLNGNIEWQFFCGIYLGYERLTNSKIVSYIRTKLSEKLDIEKMESELYQRWKPYISEPEKVVIDATCYESEVRYPTDVKLLWESVEWLYATLQKVLKKIKEKLPRTKYIKWKKRFVSYSKMRKKTQKKTRALKRSSLALIEKITTILKQKINHLNPKEQTRLELIKKVYTQQYAHFQKDIKPKNRIVSLHKAYLRPIVRGKEVKQVEFGAKVNKIQIDGISFIEHISFDAFNEGARLKSSVYKAQSLTHRKTLVVGADAIYATNENRRFITKNGIKTDFKPKGKPSKHFKEEQQLRSLITKERASSLEGSFGKEKEHYHLRKIKARTKKNEILWIFFGIHTANALEIGRRMQKALQEAA